MARSIREAVGEIKANVAKHLEEQTILGICQQLGHTWRDRVLNPAVTVQVFLVQILHGNTACQHLRHLSQRVFTAGAYCEARRRLPLELLWRLLAGVVERLKSLTEESRWHGHRVWAMDGSSFTMPDTPELRSHFGQPRAQKPGCGFPMAHLLTLFHVGTGLLQEVIVSPLYTHDLKHASRLHPQLRPGDLLLGDRGFCGFAHLAVLAKQRIQAVFRLQQNQLVSFRRGRAHVRPGKPAPRKGMPRTRWLRRLGSCDQWVEYFRPVVRSNWLSAEEFAALPEKLVLRELRFVVRQRGMRTRVVTLVTTLLDPVRYPAEDLADLYRRRWQLEGHLRDLKQTLGLDTAHCKTVPGVLKELAVFALAYNLVRLVMLESARRQRVPVERVSFVDALRWLVTAGAHVPLNRLVLNPSRSDRVEPRARKRRPTEYAVLNRPRSELRQALLRQRPAA